MKRTVVMKKLTVKFYSDGECLFYEIPEFNSSGWSKTYSSLMNELEEELLFLWDEYGMEDDRLLTPDAIELKNKVLELIEVR